jgi:hypothetical protein
MHITMVGDGGLITSLATLATRAGNTVVRIDGAAGDVAACWLSEMLIVAGDRSVVTALASRVASHARADSVVVDATATTEPNQGDAEEGLLGSEWMSLLPSTRIVRAFASVPVEAFTAIVDREPGTASDELAVPLAGDDAEAKGLALRGRKRTACRLRQAVFSFSDSCSESSTRTPPAASLRWRRAPTAAARR